MNLRTEYTQKWDALKLSIDNLGGAYQLLHAPNWAEKINLAIINLNKLQQAIAAYHQEYSQ